jgi:hypothetical protein
VFVIHFYEIYSIFVSEEDVTMIVDVGAAETIDWIVVRV